MEASPYCPSKDPLTLSTGRTLSRAAGHKVTMATFLSIIRVIKEKSVSLGWGKGYTPRPTILLLHPQGRYWGKLTVHYRGLDVPRSLDTSREDSGTGLRWPGVARIKWEFRSGQSNEEQRALDALP